MARDEWCMMFLLVIWWILFQPDWTFWFDLGVKYQVTDCVGWGKRLGWEEWGWGAHLWLAEHCISFCKFEIELYYKLLSSLMKLNQYIFLSFCPLHSWHVCFKQSSIEVYKIFQGACFFVCVFQVYSPSPDEYGQDSPRYTSPKPSMYGEYFMGKS